MSGSFCLICLSLIVSAVVPNAWCQNHDQQNSSRQRIVVPQNLEVQTISPDDLRAKLKGLCRVGWSSGTMKDFSGKEIPICLKINPDALTWSEAQQTCRKDYGFLMKFDSHATINKADLLSSVITKGITKFWTGMHTENNHLIWDDLIPNQVRPNNSGNITTTHERPWTWDDSLVPNRQEYCGQMNVEAEDKRRRKKRSSDDDSNDNFPNFESTNFPNLYEGFTGSNSEFPPTRAFQTILARTQMSDQLAELPEVLGLQSEHQIPGSGIPDANIQNGGLATDMPSFGTTSNFEQPDFETNNQFGNNDSNNGDTSNTDSNDNPDSKPLLTAVKDIAATIGSGGFPPEPSPTEAMEKLRDLLKQNEENMNSDNSDSAAKSDTPDNTFARVTTVGPPVTINVGDDNRQDDLNVDKVDDIPKVDSVELKNVPTINVQKNDNDDNSAKVDGTDIKVADIIAPLMDVRPPETIVKTVEDIIDNSKVITDTPTDDINKGIEAADSKDDSNLIPSLGFGDLADIVTNNAVNEGINLNNMKDKIDTVKDVIDDLHENQDTIMNDKPLVSESIVPDDIDNMKDKFDIVKDVIDDLNENQDTITNEKTLISETIVPDDLDKPIIENLNTLNEVDDINNVLPDIENVADRTSDIVSEIENSPSEIVDIDSLNEQIDDMNTNDGSDRAKDNLDDVVLDMPPIDINKDEPEIEPVTTDDSVFESIPDDVKTIFDEINDDLDKQEPTELSELRNDNELKNDEDIQELVSETLDIPEESMNSMAGPINDETREQEQQPVNSDFIDDIVSDIDDDKESGTTFAPEADMEPKKEDYFDDMSERLKISDETNEDLKNNFASTENPLGILKETFDDLPDYDSPFDTDKDKHKDTDFNTDKDMDTDTDFNTDGIENTDDTTGVRADDMKDDGQTKRDFDWSELDRNSNDQETVNGNDAVEVDNNDDYSDSASPMNPHQDVINTDNQEDTDGLYEKDYDINDRNSDKFEKDFEKNYDNNDVFENNDPENNNNDDIFDNFEKENDAITNDQDINDNEPNKNDNDLNENETFDGINVDTDDKLERPDNEPDLDDVTKLPDTYYEDKEEHDRFDEIPDLAEDVVEDDRKTALNPVLESKEIQLASCEVKLPSVCFSYEVEVMDKASTCDNGWYGHVLLDTCYQILDRRLSYREAELECKTKNARLVLAGSEFERKFVLTAVSKDGKLFRGAKFWMESPTDKKNCNYFDERGVATMRSCSTQLNVVCVKDAKSLSVYTVNNQPFYNEGVTGYYDSAGALTMFSSRRGDNKIPCELTSSASEFPVLWFKDGLLVETKDTYVSPDISLYLSTELISSINMVTDRNLATPALQGQYWCEVWDRQTLTRKRSKPFIVRYSDVISFHGSMELSSFSHKDEILFNMMNQKFPQLVAIETDMKKVFKDVLPMIQARLPDVVDVFTYVDGIRSKPNVIEYHTYFTLNRNYDTIDEDVVYNRLKAVLRSKLGNRNYMAELPGHTPLSSFRTMSLQSTVACPAATLQTTRDLYGHTIPKRVFSFPKALLGEFSNSIDKCSITNRLPSGTARCLGDFYTGAYWGEVVANECIEEADLDQFNNEIWGASPYTEKLTEMAQVTVDSRNVEKLVSEMANIAKMAPKFTPTDINKIADVLDHTTQVRNLPQKVGEDVLRTVDRLMERSEKESHVANVETKAANRIIKSLERYAENADIGTKDQMRFVSDNVVVEIWNLNPTLKPVIGLAAESHGAGLDKPFKTESIATVYNKSHLYDANVDAAIELPAEVFGMKEKGGMTSNRLTMMVFRKNKLFEAAITDGGRKMNPSEQQLTNLNSYVISASIAGKKLQDLNEKVKTIFKPIKNVESGSRCVWWDFDMNNFKGGWSNKGCVYDGKVNGRDVCLCDHLTNFAVLIDFYGQAKPIPDHHELSLSIITVLGLSCSILGLSLTIISYVFFRKLRQGRAQQCLFNLSLSLLLSMLVFLVGIKQTHSYFGCITVAVLLHYLILVSFMWMLMEAILQYLTFVKILGTYITRFTLKTVLPAWGLPLIPVVAVLGVDYTLYKGGPNYCWMDLPAFYYAFAIPVTCIIVINIIIFIVTIVSIFRRGKGLRSNQKKQKMAMTNLQAAITSFILLGLTWVFGYLAISDARLTFQYVFTILNSLQGFFIFILFVVRKKKVREQWYFICCKGVEKDRVSRSLSASNSIPSTYSNGSRKDGRERDRSDSTKTVTSTYSNSSNGYTNYGYDHAYDFPFNRYDRRAFKKF